MNSIFNIKNFSIGIIFEGFGKDGKSIIKLALTTFVSYLSNINNYIDLKNRNNINWKTKEYIYNKIKENNNEFIYNCIREYQYSIQNVYLDKTNSGCSFIILFIIGSTVLIVDFGICRCISIYKTYNIDNNENISHLDLLTNNKHKYIHHYEFDEDHFIKDLKPYIHEFSINQYNIFCIIIFTNSLYLSDDLITKIVNKNLDLNKNADFIAKNIVEWSVRCQKKKNIPLNHCEEIVILF